MGVIKVGPVDTELKLILGRWEPELDGRSLRADRPVGRKNLKKLAAQSAREAVKEANRAANKAYVKEKRRKCFEEAYRLAWLIPDFGALCITEQNKVIQKLRGQLIREGFGHE